MADQLSSGLLARLKDRAGNAERSSDDNEMAANSQPMQAMLDDVPKSDDPAVRDASPVYTLHPAADAAIVAAIDAAKAAGDTLGGVIEAVVTGRADRKDNLLKNAPHTAGAVTASEWTHPYSREEAAFPLPFVRSRKYWPAVGRIDNPYGDRNLFCSCPPVESFA